MPVETHVCIHVSEYYCSPILTQTGICQYILVNLLNLQRDEVI
jgi:hypothetical protein